VRQLEINQTNRMSRIVKFYRNEESYIDDSGIEVILDSILNVWSHDYLEECHSFIQWMFPLKEPSRFNPSAPLLTDEDIKIFRADNLIQSNLSKSLNRMLDFYGFEWENARIVLAPNWTGEWLAPNNHNLLRITRILGCLRLVSSYNLADYFMTILNELKDVPSLTREYWRAAPEQPKL
jgi:hypothetical protein